MQKRTLSTQRQVATLIDRASEILPLVWPLKNYIPSNPLKDLEKVPFEDALCDVTRLFSCHQREDAVFQRVNKELIKWCQSFLDQGQAPIPLPDRQRGFYRAWVSLAVYDKYVHCHCAKVKNWLRSLPYLPEEAIIQVIKNLKVPQNQYVEFLMCMLACLPGWAGYLKWASSSYVDARERRGCLAEFLAVRLCMTWSFVLAGHPFPQRSWKSLSNGLDKEKLKKVKASETAYHEHLVQLLSKRASLFPARPRALAQFVFCIDVRSESLRREIERSGVYETYGVAGFFHLPIRVKKRLEKNSVPFCPALLKSQHEVQEKVSSAHALKQNILQKFRRFYQSLKDGFATPFALVEMLGGLAGIWMGAHVLCPEKTAKLKQFCQRAVGLETKRAKASQIIHTIPLEKQIAYAESVLQVIGLTDRFSPYVVLCGHTSQTENNPYASALECGACGGNGGGMNARVLAKILDSPKVREGLAKKGISIPPKTCFIAAEHDTATDIISFYAEHIPNNQTWLNIKKGVETASLRNRIKRAKTFYTSSSRKRLSRSMLKKSIDWSDTRPEWGLLGNAAFVVGRRELTKSIDLNNRCFLHSYDHQKDPSGKLLESIVTAPVLVAQWINAHYFFSSFDPTLFGAGSKVTQNVVGKMGVMQGNGSDLLFGLPMQSVRLSDEKRLYSPMRLLVVIHAPLGYVKKILTAHREVRNIFYNEWGKLAVLCPHDRVCYQLASGGQWKGIDLRSK